MLDLLPPPQSVPTSFAFAGPPVPGLAVARRKIGRRRDLAVELDLAEVLGVDMVHAATAELLAAGAWPRAAIVHVAAGDAAAVAPAVVAGALRACRSHDVAIAAVDFVAAPGVEHVHVSLLGGVGRTMRVPAAGDTVLALRGNGPLDGDLPWLIERMSQLALHLGDPLPNGDTLGRALVTAQKSPTSVLHEAMRKVWPARLVAVDAAGLHASLQAALPAGLQVDLDLARWSPPEPFATLLRGTTAAAAAARSSAGCCMLAIVPPDDVSRWREHIGAWNEVVEPIGVVAAARR